MKCHLDILSEQTQEVTVAKLEKKTGSSLSFFTDNVIVNSDHFKKSSSRDFKFSRAPPNGADNA